MRISVITVNYNNLEGLKKTVKSVLGQTLRDLEYIVIDGGSNDGSEKFLEEHRSNFAYVVSEKDRGIYDAMNKGIEKAKGDYLLFLNSGDYFVESNTLKKVFSKLDGSGIIYGNMKLDVNGKIINGFMPKKLDVLHMLKDTLWHPVSFIHKKLFLEYGAYSTQYKICGDYDFFFNMVVSKKVSTKHISQFITVFVLDGMSSEISNKSIIEKERQAIQKNYLSDAELNHYNNMPGKRSVIHRLKTYFKP